SDTEFMDHVREKRITATTASALLSAATDVGRLNDLKKAFKAWLEKTLVKIEAKRKARADIGSFLPIKDTLPKNYLTTELVKSWKMALKSGKPLSQEPGFEYCAGITATDEGGYAIKVEGISGDLKDFDEEEKKKLFERFEKLSNDLKLIAAGKALT